MAYVIELFFCSLFLFQCKKLKVSIQLSSLAIAKMYGTPSCPQGSTRSTDTATSKLFLERQLEDPNLSQDERKKLRKKLKKKRQKERKLEQINDQEEASQHTRSPSCFQTAALEKENVAKEYNKEDDYNNTPKNNAAYYYEEEKKEDEVPSIEESDETRAAFIVSKSEKMDTKELEKRDGTTPISSFNQQQGERRANLFCRDGENDTDDRSSREILMSQAQLIEDDLLVDLQVLTKGLSPQLQPLEEEKLACKIHHLEEQFVLMANEMKEKNQQSKEKISTLEERIETLITQALVGKKLHHNSYFGNFWKTIRNITYFIVVQFPLEILKTSVPWFFSFSFLIIAYSYFLCLPQLPQLENIPGIL